MPKPKETHKRFTDQERYEHCRKFKISGLSLAEYARQNGLNRSTFRDWISAYNNINGKPWRIYVLQKNYKAINK